jgi:hypothetical protein
VHYPIDYSQSVNSPEACRKRLFKYVIPVIIISIIINIPKFLESYIGTYYKVFDPETNTTKTIFQENDEVSFYILHLQPPLHQILDSIVVSIPACHAGGRGSIPRRGEIFFRRQQQS